MNPDAFSELAAARYSVRDFRPDPVATEIVEEILEDTRQAPSWSNTRPFMLALATGERADRLRAAYIAEFDVTLPVQHKKRGAMVRLALSGKAPDGDYRTWAPHPADLLPHSQAVGSQLYAHMGIARDDRKARDAAVRRNCEAFGAPVIGFVLVHKGLMPFAALDAGIMLQTLFLSAKAHGVDSCPLGVLATWRRPFDAEFEAPADYRLITGFALGYASDAPVNDFRAERRAVRLVPARS
ncbi:nitroreductase family protein [Actinomyces sp. oral taxon 170]|uniref:nitroreductase family protein n=1 Tax=Actinomyces sp. oral taxon 170 TaxID=712117 RepID=UPI000205D79E|nr:nitroreductase family protein [Actinomyces sp. oral taxon 170]EGF55950.1 nitroreductase family protein [Actinomyces sp. oral taxon 170 str. F0386]